MPVIADNATDSKDLQDALIDVFILVRQTGLAYDNCGGMWTLSSRQGINSGRPQTNVPIH